jgi:thioesterase domain-containing protein
MNEPDLQEYLHTHIPLSRAMDVTVTEATRERVVLSAPLAPNINHRETAFGGSLSTLAILSAWSLLQLRLRSEGQAARLVIHQNTMHYDAPATSTFTATAQAPTEESWRRFTQTLSRRGKARVSVSSLVESDGALVGRFEGEFVALVAA